MSTSTTLLPSGLPSWWLTWPNVLLAGQGPTFLRCASPENWMTFVWKTWKVIQQKNGPFQSSSFPAFVPMAHCKTTSWRAARNAKMSFPSGHAALSTFACLCLFFYLRTAQMRHPYIHLKLLMATVSSAFTVFTVLCCISRVTDGWHYPTDVIGGITYGAILFQGIRVPSVWRCRRKEFWNASECVRLPQPVGARLPPESNVNLAHASMFEQVCD